MGCRCRFQVVFYQLISYSASVDGITESSVHPHPSQTNQVQQGKSCSFTIQVPTQNHRLDDLQDQRRTFPPRPCHPPAFMISLVQNNMSTSCHHILFIAQRPLQFQVQSIHDHAPTNSTARPLLHLHGLGIGSNFALHSHSVHRHVCRL